MKAYPYSASAYSEGSMKGFFGQSPQNDNRQKAAFTLAEVLITIAIIGVVAALTIPTLVANYKERVMVTKVKQAHSQLVNAINLYVAKNNCSNMLCLFDTSKTSTEVAQELATVLKAAKICTASDSRTSYCKGYAIKQNKPTYKVDGKWEAGDYMYTNGRIYLQNGVTYWISMNTTCVHQAEYIVRDENGYDTGERTTYTSNNCGYIYIDINNIEEPNQFGADCYRYDVKVTGTLEPYDSDLLNNVLLNNKIEYTPYNVGDSVN